MNYNQSIILGTGELAYKCAKFLKKNQIHVKFFDTNFIQSKMLQRKIENEEIIYFHKTKNELLEPLEQINQPTVLISAINPYIIPRKILENSKIRAINLHPSLLPKHPGRNVEAWTIFELDNEAGITWHTISQRIDSGEIISQKKILLDDSYTSIKLLKNLNQIAFNAFIEIFDMVFNQEFMQYTKSEQKRNLLHYSWEKPNDGYLDLSWNGEKISAFIRAMDYGYLELLGKPKVVFHGKCYTWKSYKINKVLLGLYERIEISNLMIRILKPGFNIELHDLAEIMI